MKSKVALLALASAQILILDAFAPAVSVLRLNWTPPNKCLIFSQSSTKEQCRTRVQAATATSSTTNANLEVNAENQVSRVSVCAGELCQCQGEQYEYTGGASDAILEELQSLDLPFPVDEVGCLGACGMGTMIAIDYDNGDSIMTDGRDSTLVELGIQPQDMVPSVSETENEITENGAHAEPAADINGEMATPSVVSIASATNIVEDKGIKQVTKPPLLADTRDRMREEAIVEVENPWMNMASYLAKKAAGNLFGSE